MGKIKRVKGSGKIKNATAIEYDGIKFRSKLEAFAYQEFKKAGIEVEYEKETYTILEAFEYNGQKIRPIRYTPDFIGDKLLIEIKGFANDGFENKFKTFKKYLKINNIDFQIYIIKNKKQVLQFIEDYKSNKPYNNIWSIYSNSPRKKVGIL